MENSTKAVLSEDMGSWDAHLITVPWINNAAIQLYCTHQSSTSMSNRSVYCSSS
jgi:hypothetical protein